MSSGDGASFNAARTTASSAAPSARRRRSIRAAIRRRPDATLGRGRRPAQPGHPDDRDPTEPRRRDPPSQPGHRRDAWPTNANAGSGDANARRIIAYGLRNPFRFTINPARTSLARRRRLEHVGGDQRIPDPTAGAPTSAGRATRATASLPFFDNLTCPCATRSSARSVTPRSTRITTRVGRVGRRLRHGQLVDLRSGVPAILQRYPSVYDNGLFFTDYSRGCIWFIPDNGSGTLNAAGRISSRTWTARTRRRRRRRLPGRRADRRPRVRRLRPRRGPPHPLLRWERAAGRDRSQRPHPSGRRRSTVSFNASGSSDANGETFTYAWDLDGDAQSTTRPA